MTRGLAIQGLLATLQDAMSVSLSGAFKVSFSHLGSKWCQALCRGWRNRVNQGVTRQ